MSAASKKRWLVSLSCARNLVNASSLPNSFFDACFFHFCIILFSFVRVSVFGGFRVSREGLI